MVNINAFKVFAFLIHAGRIQDGLNQILDCSGSLGIQCTASPQIHVIFDDAAFAYSVKAGIGYADKLHTQHRFVPAGVNVINWEVHGFQADIIGNFAKPGPMAGVAVCDKLVGEPLCNAPGDTIPLLDIAVLLQLLAGFSD